MKRISGAFRNLIIAGLVATLLVPVAMANPAVYHGKHYQRGLALYNQGKTSEAIHELEHAVAGAQYASYFRALAKAYERAGQYQKASETYAREADLYKQKGDIDAYLVQKAKADSLATDIKLFKQEAGYVKETVDLAKYEPAQGLYIGAFVEYDSKIGHHNVAGFNELTGKDHAVYYTYHAYGADFPVNWAAQAKSAGAAIHLAWEPNGGLDKVKDDAYLRQFARAAKAAGMPIFLRFASEMNGDWVAWNGNPAAYIEKFRLVARVMKEEAPNVAMVWSPNSVPQKEITKYYPGDEYVDWVGVNLYSVAFFNGDANRPADTVNPLDLLDFVYKQYSSRKPIMVSEYAATHYSSAGNKDCTQFAITKMNMLYQGVKLLYPRVKAINWYSVNNLVDAHSPERRLNNFSLTENPKVLEAYRNLIKAEYFLETVENGPGVANSEGQGVGLTPLANGTVREDVKVLAWVKTYDPYISKVVYKLDGQVLTTASQYPFAADLAVSKLSNGQHSLEVIVYDAKGKEAARKTTRFKRSGPIPAVTGKEVSLILNESTAYTAHGKVKLAGTPYTKNDRTLVPLRFISENFGAGVTWDGQSKRITIKGNKTIVLQLGSRTVKVNGVVSQLETVPEERAGVTYVPLRFVSQHLGASINFDAQENRIDIQ